MRAPCLNCVRKHLAQAEILFAETALGHPMHLYLALGHLAEAEHEALHIDAELAGEIRGIRMICDAESSGRSFIINYFLQRTFRCESSDAGTETT